ncbi:MAG: hypothetical protein WCL30_01825 [Pseudomonadota bacterium]
MKHNPPDPYIVPIFFDSCAFDPSDSQENEASYELKNNTRFDISISGSVKKEMLNPNAPFDIRNQAINGENNTPRQFDMSNCDEYIKGKILEIITGNGKKENMVKDAKHIYTSHHRGGYFVTTDKKLIKRRDQLYDIPINCIILLPSELLTIVERFDERNRLSGDY